MNPAPLRRLAMLLIAAASGLASAQTQLDEWPREYEVAAGTLLVFQPQPDALHGNRLEARAAVSFTPRDAAGPVFGAVWFEARIETDRDERKVLLYEIQLRQVRFSEEMASRVSEATIREAFPRELETWLDELISTLTLAQRDREELRGLPTTPPRIRFVAYPATLVTVEGPPELRFGDDLRVMRVVNTPAFLFLATNQGTYWLRGSDAWFASRDVIGSWRRGTPPPEVVTAAKRAVATVGVVEPTVSRGTTPIVATEPTVLISTNGDPTYTAIEGTGLLYLANSASDVFLETATRRHFLLASGRWFASDSLQRGPWRFVAADALPVDFARIPAGSPKGHVLAAVAGTEEAEAAVLDASVPQTAAIARDATIDVTYDGAPRFEPIPDSTLAWAVNSPYDVMRVHNRFYCCHEATWYEAADPWGPWGVCVAVPDVIYTIPPRVPVHRVRYVRVYHHTPTLVYVGYTPGYFGCHVFGPTVVYGTGYWYRPHCGRHYFPRPITWGYPVVYRPYRGWVFGAGLFSGLWIHLSWGGWYVRHRHWRSHHHHYRHHRHRRHVARHHRPPRAKRPSRRPPPRARRRRRPQVTRKAHRNNVFVDRKGALHRRSQTTWQRRVRGRWQDDKPVHRHARRKPGPERPVAKKPGQRPAKRPVQRPGQRPARPTVRTARPTKPHRASRLDRHHQARQRGSARTKRAWTMSRSGATAPRSKAQRQRARSRTPRRR